MKSFEEFRLDEGKDRSTSKVEAMETLFDALRKAFDGYSLATRNFVWDKIQSGKGKNLVEKILKDPKVKISEGEIRKIAINK
jgi:hypothetical protein